MQDSKVFADVLFHIGPIGITDSVVTVWVLLFLLVFVAWLLGGQLKKLPVLLQTFSEGIVTAIENAVKAVLPQHYERVVPFIMALWIFLVIANLIGLIPGLHSPTRDLSVTAALAFVVFISVHWYGIRIQGIKQYLKHYLTPHPVMLPFHIINEITRTVALAVRLFGNIMSLELVALLLLLVAGFLVPVPILMLHIIEALVQAYIFGMLALIYIAGGIQLNEERIENTQTR